MKATSAERTGRMTHYNVMSKRFGIAAFFQNSIQVWGPFTISSALLLLMLVENDHSDH